MRFDVPTVSMSFVHPRSVAASVALAMAERRVLHRLRTDAGISYGAGRQIEQVAPDVMLSVLSSDLLYGHEQQATDLFLATLDEVAADGFRPEELDRERALWNTGRTSPDHVVGEMNRRAFRLVTGGDPDDDPWADLASLDVDDASASFARLLSESLFVAPSGVAITSDATPLPDWSESSVQGRELSRMTLHQLPDAPKARVVVGDEGVTLRLDDERRVTVSWAACTAAVHNDQGHWLLYGADGFRLFLNPAEWVRGDVLADALEEHVPRDVRVPATVDEPGLPEAGGVPRDPAQVQRFRPHIPWWRLPGLSSWVVALMAVPLGFFTLFCVTSVLFPGDDPDFVRPFALLFGMTFGVPTWWLWHELIRRGHDPLPPTGG